MRNHFDNIKQQVRCPVNEVEQGPPNVMVIMLNPWTDTAFACIPLDTFVYMLIIQRRNCR